MLLRANAEPIVALPIGERAITKNEATAASRPARRARTRTRWSGCLLFADFSS